MIATVVPTRVVVVGCGIAGVSTCDALRAGGFDGRLILVDDVEVPHSRRTRRASRGDHRGSDR